MKAVAVAVFGAGTAALIAVAFILFAGGRWLIREVAIQDDASTCTAGKFEIESRSARSESRRIIVTAAVRNNNPIACGVQVSVAVKDKAGKQVAIDQLWVAGVGNIPAGATHEFPVYLTPEVSEQAEGGDFDITPISTRVWRQQ
ncbi:MAG: hypothetical protein EOP82_14365 [Variovorax sp.]|nr:MAG: hypothetical protein EOP82_14365 [Variovorax sp.]